jgi:phosphatidate cytidylyltransferase
MLKTRIVTALFLVAGLSIVLFLLPPAYAGVAFAVVAALAAWEWAGLMRQDGTARVLFALLQLVFCWQIQTAMDELSPLLLSAAALFWIVGVPLWLRFKWSLAGNDFLGYSIGMILIIPTWVAMVSLYASSPWLLLAAMGLVWVADIGAYFTGRAFGKRKLAPSISPGKTWEGVAGAGVGVLIYGAVILMFTPVGKGLGLPVFLLVLMLFGLTAISVIGDLFESLLKRQAGIKDSSQMLPGHGGVLDRIDSLTSTLPVAALILYWVTR